MLDMVPTSLVTAVAPRAGKFIKNGLIKIATENGKPCVLGSTNCQKLRWKIRIYVDEKPTLRLGT